jgi:hypothetical protein
MPNKANKPVIPVEPEDWSQRMSEKYSNVNWGVDSIMISGLPPGWEKIGEELIKAINDYTSTERRVPDGSLAYHTKTAINAVTQKCLKLVNPFLKVRFRAKLANKLRIYTYTHYVSSYPPRVTIEQIKEKFASLRVYHSGGDEQVRGMIFMAESMCAHTCQSTGGPGVFTKINGWGSILDPKVVKKIKKERGIK